MINELVTNPQSVNWDGGSYPTQAQWLELYNMGPTALSLANWRIAAAGQLQPATLPAGQHVAPHGYLVLFKRDLGLDLAQGPVSLLDPSGNVIDSVSPPALPPDQSYARLPDGSGTWLVNPTPTLNAANVWLLSESTPDLAATAAALETQVAQPLPIVTSVLDDGQPDASDLATPAPRRTPRTRKQTYRPLPISAIRSLADGTAVIAGGVVTMPTGRWDPSRGYIEDGAAGILVHSYQGESLRQDQPLVVRGRVHHYRGEVEIAEVKDGQELAPAGNVPAPRPVPPAAVGPATEGLLVKVTGPVTAVQRTYAVIGRGLDTASVYLYDTLGLETGALRPGQQVSVVGVVNASGTAAGESPPPGYAQLGPRLTHRLLPRSPADIITGAAAAAPEPVSAATLAARSARVRPSGLSAALDQAQPSLSSSPGAIARPFATPVRSSHSPAPVPVGATAGAAVLALGSGERGPAWPWLVLGAAAGALGAGIVVALAPALRRRVIGAEGGHEGPPSTTNPD